MTSDDESKSALAKWEEFKGDERPADEHILNMFRAVLSSVPHAGAIPSLLTDYIPNARARRLEKFAEEVAQDIYRLQDRVNTGVLLTDDFAFMFEQSFRAAAENPQQGKLQAFRAIIVNSAIRQDLSAQQKEFFLNLAMGLTTVHIRLLQIMTTAENSLGEAGPALDLTRGIPSEQLVWMLPGIPLQMVQSAISNLIQAELILPGRNTYEAATDSRKLLLFQGRVTPFARQFIGFCTLPE